ncbi:hypothetical protein GCM10020221_13950 [Streptomyces thioluteus]|uniref:Uncharacterized protein n=1 Tax=Streptomyces thioluteus TaxID=66431 RepID=A0ABP6J2U6_STRTU
MGAVKGAVLSCSWTPTSAGTRSMITFRGSARRSPLPPTSSVDAGAARLEKLPTGGRTPLAAGLLQAHEVLRVERLRDPVPPPPAGRGDGRAGPPAAPSPLARAARAAGLLPPGAPPPSSSTARPGPYAWAWPPSWAARSRPPSSTLDELRADSVSALVRTVRNSNGSNTSRKAA